MNASRSHLTDQGLCGCAWQRLWIVSFSTLALVLMNFAMLALTGLGQAPKGFGPSVDRTPDVDGLEKEIAGWIGKLGDPNYATRLQAQSELERIGIRALDQLHRASFHPDPQISSQARYLVQSNQFQWAWDTDPYQVRRILSNYTTAALYEKSAFIDQLHALEDDEGLPALCRLIRYETQGCLAKRAALLLMRDKARMGQSLEEKKRTIASLVEGGMSSAGRWVLTYTQTTATPAIDFWLEKIEEEKALLAAKSPDSSIEILTDLRKWVVEQLAKTPDLREQALTIARTIPEQTTAPNPNRSMNSVEFAQWALDAGLPEMVQEQHDQLSDLALLESRFGYLLAESYLQQDNRDLARQIAALALERKITDAKGQPRVFDPNRRDASPLNQRLEEMLQRNVSLVFERSAIAEYLINRGQWEWAESELRLAISGHEDDVEFSTIINLTQLSQMLHELHREAEAADVLKKFSDRFEREPLFRSQVAEQGGESLVSNHYLYLGDAARSEGDHEKARPLYLKSIELAQDNVDAIIGLYRLNIQTEDFIAERKRIQHRVSTELRQEIDIRERELKRDNPRFQATEQRSLANQMNTLAWLICNTEGNFEEALHLSRKACALSPNRSAYLDTLAHCYATLGRYQDAVVQQRKAVALEPFQPSLVEALQEFEERLAAGSRQP